MDQVVQHTYPFTAIVGQDMMKLALSLVAVQPQIGGVLIQGERGTAKTTAVRVLPGVLEGSKRVIELPLNATEDRVVGTIDVRALMDSGQRAFVPGVLFEADGNILYVDEINLLEDHIVDLLLDAAATGTCRIEREGVSQVYPARFVLVGTMNPEEGTLRPQLLDRFGLSVKIAGSLDAQERLDLVRRHIDFEQDPDAFCARFADSQQAYAERIARAVELYPQVALSDEMAAFSAGLCFEVGVDGYRADIVMMRTTRALAALDGRHEVAEDDVLLAARLVLPHRMKRLPFEEVNFDEKTIDRALDALEERGVTSEAGRAGKKAGGSKTDATVVLQEGESGKKS